jgi:hypothetical protein
MDRGEDIESIYVIFHNRARELFFSLFRDFNASIEGLNRHRDEYLFRQQREQYVTHLQQQLQLIAQEILRQHQYGKNGEPLSRNLNHFITDYVHQFVQKVKAL